MIYPFTLQEISLVLGALYLLSHGLALVRPTLCRDFLLAAPRNYPLGAVLMTVSTAWFTWLMASIDLMEYTRYQKIFTIVALAGGALVIFFLRELLTGRALGSLLLLVAYVLLDASFMRDEPLKLVLVCTAYAYIIAGMVLVSSPYRLRDVIQWIYQNERRAQIAAGLGLVFGAVLLVLGLTVF